MAPDAQYPPPLDWQSFERLCRDLWAEIWRDANAQRNGRSGFSQDGVDVYGRKGGLGKWMGVQCKLKDQLYEGQLTRAEILAEVEKAKRFQQGDLSDLVIATTAPKEGKVQLWAREITEDQESEGSFPVTVFAWDDIRELLPGYPNLVRKHFGSDSGAGQKPFHVPFRPLKNLLKGREKELEQLAAGLREGRESKAGAFAVEQLEAVHGLGGVGKTALAVEHAWRCRDQYSAIFFVGAESPTSLQAGLADLAPLLGLPGREDQAAMVAAVFQWLGEREGWLLILDNVDDGEAREAVEGILHQLSKGRVLITSRLKNWPGSVKRIPLGFLSPEEAIAFLLERAPQRRKTSDDQAEAAALAEELGYLPLALEQAAAYVDVQGESFAEYRRFLAENSADALGWYDKDAMQYPHPLAAAWHTSFERLGPSAQTMLHLLAFLAPEGIQKEWFESIQGRFDLADAIRDLSAYSLLQTEEEGYRIHRMVQEVVISRLDLKERRDWIDSVADLLNTTYPGDPQDARYWPEWGQLRPHLSQCIRHGEGVCLRTLALARLMNGLAGFLEERFALYSDAELLFRKALAFFELELGRDHAFVGSGLNNLGRLLKSTERFEEAEPLMRRALKIFEANYGNDHPEVVVSLNNLAQLLRATDRFEEAEPLMQRALKTIEVSKGEDHPDISFCLNNLGQLLKATGRIKEAEPLMQRALSIDEATFGESSPRVAVRLNNLACMGSDVQSTLLPSTRRTVHRALVGRDEGGTFLPGWVGGSSSSVSRV